MLTVENCWKSSNIRLRVDECYDVFSLPGIIECDVDCLVQEWRWPTSRPRDFVPTCFDRSSMIQSLIPLSLKDAKRFDWVWWYLMRRFTSYI